MEPYYRELAVETVDNLKKQFPKKSREEICNALANQAIKMSLDKDRDGKSRLLQINLAICFKELELAELENSPPKDRVFLALLIILVIGMCVGGIIGYAYTK